MPAISALDWKPLIPGLLRLLAAVALSMTALGNWWTVDSSGYEGSTTSTHAAVLPLIGCIGVTLAALVQLPLLPQFLGGSIPPLARLGIRCALCLPALIAVCIAVVTHLGGLDSGKAASAGVMMLAMAIGFALAGLDDAHDQLPKGTTGYVAMGAAALGIALTLVSMVQILGLDTNDASTGATFLTSTKAKWLLAMPTMFFVAALGGVIIWIALTRISFGFGLVCAATAGVTISLLTRGWIQSDASLLLTTVVRQGHGAPLIALALALMSSAWAGGNPADTAADHASSLRRLTGWVAYGFGFAAFGALITALTFTASIGDGSGGYTWFAVLMFITALAYAASAYLLRTHALGRVIALGTTAVISLTILITLAASSAGEINEAFTEGAFLWVPVIASLLLTLPPSVRALAGPILPNRSAAAPVNSPVNGETR